MSRPWFLFLCVLGSPPLNSQSPDSSIYVMMQIRFACEADHMPIKIVDINRLKASGVKIDLVL